MNLFQIALFLHIIALVVAGGVTAITKLAAARRARARTVGDALDWHNVLMSAARIFPICIAVFVITGGYMLSVNKLPVSTGFIVAGLTASVWLLATGAFLGVKGKGLGQMLAGLAAKGADQPAPRLVPPPAAVMLPVINTGVAIGVAFDMVTRQPSIPVALTVVAVGGLIGAVLSMRHAAPAPVAQPARQ
jgi:hypothetical protein